MLAYILDYIPSFIHGRSQFYLAVDVVVYVQLGLERIFSVELTTRVVELTIISMMG